MAAVIMRTPDNDWRCLLCDRAHRGHADSALFYLSTNGDEPVGPFCISQDCLDKWRAAPGDTPIAKQNRAGTECQNCRGIVPRWLDRCPFCAQSPRIVHP